MNANLLKTLKTILMAAAAAGIHAFVEHAPSIAAILPAKYAGLLTVFATAAALYLKNPPTTEKPAADETKSPWPPSGAAMAFALVLGLLCGAMSSCIRAGQRPNTPDAPKKIALAAGQPRQIERYRPEPVAGEPEPFFDVEACA